MLASASLAVVGLGVQQTHDRVPLLGVQGSFLMLFLVYSGRALCVACLDIVLLFSHAASSLGARSGGYGFDGMGRLAAQLHGRKVGRVAGTIASHAHIAMWV